MSGRRFDRLRLPASGVYRVPLSHASHAVFKTVTETKQNFDIFSVLFLNHSHDVFYHRNEFFQVLCSGYLDSITSLKADASFTR